MRGLLIATLRMKMAKIVLIIIERNSDLRILNMKLGQTKSSRAIYIAKHKMYDQTGNKNNKLTGNLWSRLVVFSPES